MQRVLIMNMRSPGVEVAEITIAYKGISRFERINPNSTEYPNSSQTMGTTSNHVTTTTLQGYAGFTHGRSLHCFPKPLETTQQYSNSN